MLCQECGFRSYEATKVNAVIGHVAAALVERERQGILIGLKKALEIVGDAGYVVEATALGDLVAEIERAERGEN